MSRDSKEAIAVFVANIESNLVGYCMTSVKDRIGEIDSIYINPQYRGKKLGEQLMEKAESWLKSKKIIKFSISVVEGNESVFDFYNKQGYHPKHTVLEKKA